MESPPLNTPGGNPAFRSSQRLTITVAQATLEALVDRSSCEGRSLSNLAAYLLESSLEAGHGPGPRGQRP
mgnify:FL=1